MKPVGMQGRLFCMTMFWFCSCFLTGLQVEKVLAFQNKGRRQLLWDLIPPAL